MSGPPSRGDAEEDALGGTILRAYTLPPLPFFASLELREQHTESEGQLRSRDTSLKEANVYG